MIKSINAWRGIFAIIIVLFHSEVHLMDQAVTLGVSFFFVASGFLLTLRHHEKELTTPSVWWRFWWKRALRIYPVHWLALACYMVFYLWVKNQPFKLPEFIAEIALVQCWIPNKDYFFAYNGISWFLGALLFLYACFPLINKYYSRLRLRWQMLTLGVLMTALACLLPYMSKECVLYSYVCPVVRLGDFLMGVTAANAYRVMSRSGLKYGTAKATIIELAAILIAIEVIFINRSTELLSIWGNYLIWWIPATFIVFSAAMLNGQEGLVGRMLTKRPLQFLGKISLEIYLFQHVVAFFVNYYISPIYGHFGLLIYDHYVWTQLPLLILLSWGIYKFRHSISHRLTTTASSHD